MGHSILLTLYLEEAPRAVGADSVRMEGLALVCLGLVIRLTPLTPYNAQRTTSKKIQEKLYKAPLKPKIYQRRSKTVNQSTRSIHS